MNLFGNCCGGCNSSCDTLWYIIIISLLTSCGCGCCNNNGCNDRYDGGMNKGDCGCGCGIDFCTLLILFLVFGCGNKCCK